MAVTRTSFLFGLLVFLCLSLSSANRVLKHNNAEKEAASNNASSAQNDQLENFSNADLNNSKVLKGGVPKYISPGPTTGDCCSYDHCGEYVCPPTYSCGGNSGCSSYYTCPWQGCQGCQYQGCQGCQGCQYQGCQGCQGSQGCQGCQGSQGCQGCQGCQGSQGCQGCQGCQVCRPQPMDSIESSKVQESDRIAERDRDSPEVLSPLQPGNHNMGADQEINSNGGIV